MGQRRSKYAQELLLIPLSKHPCFRKERRDQETRIMHLLKRKIRRGHVLEKKEGILLPHLLSGLEQLFLEELSKVSLLRVLMKLLEGGEEQRSLLVERLTLYQE